MGKNKQQQDFDILKCRNPKCRRYGVAVTFAAGGRRYLCTECKSLLYYCSGDELVDAIIDDESTAFDSEDADSVAYGIMQHGRYSAGNSYFDVGEPYFGSHKRDQRDYRSNRNLQPQLSQPLQQQPKREEVFEVLDCNPDVKGCPIVGELGKPVVNVPIELWNRFIYLASQLDYEWFAYLKGEQVGDSNTYNITEAIYPKQKMAGATCVATDEASRNIPDSVIGDIHSHVKMQAKFSSHDEANMSRPVTLVINARGEHDCVVRVKLECGRYTRVDAKVMLTGVEQLQQLEEHVKAQRVVEAVYICPSCKDRFTSTGYCPRCNPRVDVISIAEYERMLAVAKQQPPTPATDTTITDNKSVSNSKITEANVIC